MSGTLKQLAKRVVRGVGSAPADVPAAGSRRPVRSEPPVLGHRPGIDRNDYGLSLEEARRYEPEFTAYVNNRSYRIFFLCGHPRSGTHWMDSVLNRHPRIVIDGEYRFESLRRATDDITGRHWHAAFREPMKSEAERCFRDTIRRVVGASSSRKPNADWLGDRTPRVVEPYLPGAPHFLIIRDPRDVIVSWAHQELKNEGFHYVSGGYESELGQHRRAFVQDPTYFKQHPGLLLGNERWMKQLSGRWRLHVRLDLDIIRRVDSGELPARIHVVRYEKIHSDPEGERERMYRFLGVSPDEAEPLSEETRSKPGHGKEDPHSIYRKGAVGDWEKYFTPEVRAWFKEMANDALVELGYESDADW